LWTWRIIKLVNPSRVIVDVYVCVYMCYIDDVLCTNLNKQYNGVAVYKLKDSHYFRKQQP